MSRQTMPLLFLNMGGEMVYILDQRLRAQSVAGDKGIRVMVDIVGTMFSAKFIDEIFKPQELYSRAGMRALFDKLAHASIMRLNSTSMDKLYDLMTMAVKYQLCNCKSPKDVLIVTLNHLDGMRKLVHGQTATQTLIDHAFDKMKATYFDMNAHELYILRMTLLTFYQDCRVKVSMLLREHKQRDDGRFVIPVKGAKCPYGGEIPGTIRRYVDGKEKVDTFNTAASYTATIVDASLAKTAKPGERVIDLGCNMYKGTRATEVQGGIGSTTLTKASTASHGGDQQMALLAKLLKPATKAKEDNFSFSLFDTEAEESGFTKLNKSAAKAMESNLVKIDASHRDKKAVEKMVGEMSVGEKKKPKKKKGDELLQMMDDMNN